MEIRYYLAKYHKTNVLKWQHVEDFCRIMRKCLDANNSEFSNADSVQDPHHSKASVSLDKLGCEWNGNRDIVSESNLFVWADNFHTPFNVDICYSRVDYLGMKSSLVQHLC